MATKKPKRNSNKKPGLSIGGNVSVKDGDFVAGDKIMNLDQGSSYVGGNVSRSNIVTGNANDLSNRTALREDLYEEIFKKIEARPGTKPEDKDDLKANVEEIKTEVEKGEQADETFLARRLRNIQRMAPDILDVVIAAMTNPAAGFAMAARKIAEQARKNDSESGAKA